MACRPKDERLDDDGTSSKIFKSLGESEAGRSFHANASTPRGKKGPPRANTASFTRGGRENALRDGEDGVRSMQAMQMRETMGGRGHAGTKLPRGQTFSKEVAKEQDGAFDDGDEEEEEENVEPNTSMSRRSKLVAQLELAQASSHDEDAAPPTASAKNNLNLRFKSTNTGAGADSKALVDED